MIGQIVYGSRFYLGPIKLGRLLEETMRVEDHHGRLNRINKKQ
jgi:hypothetical protein